ncbi:MAG: AMIN domain-containing protein, partial [Gammaproteobacteria bacterium]
MKQGTLNSVAAVVVFAWLAFGIGAARADTPTPARALTAIKTVALSGGRIEVDLQLDRAAPKPLSFSVNQPAMIVLDLDNTSPALAASRQLVNAGNVASVETASAGGRTRVVINLDAMAPYQTRVEGDHVYVIVGGAALAQTAAKPAEKTFGPASGSESSPPAASAHAITGVSFHRTADGSGRIEIALAGSQVAGSVKREGKQVIVNFPGASVPARLQERLNVTDFATPVTTVTTRQTASGVQVTIQANGDFEQLAFQADKTFAVELKPTSPQEIAAAGTKHYSGKKLTLNFQNIPVRAVLQILADFTHKNIVVSGSVGGNITLRLHDVPWDEALDIILRTQGLAMRKSGDVIMIAPAVEFARQEQQQLKAQSQVQQLVPLDTAYLQINYAKASGLAALISAQKNSLLSSRGTVTTDQRTNTLIVHDTDDHIAQVRKLVHV